MEIAKVKVSGTRAYTMMRSSIPAGIVGGTITVEYGPEWENLTVTAVFRGCETKDVIDAGKTIIIPHETVATPGKDLHVGFYGVDSEGSIVIPTLWTCFGMIAPAADPSGDESHDPSLPVWEQVLRRITDSENNAQAHAVAAAESETNAKLSEGKALQSESNAKASENAAANSSSSAENAAAAAEGAVVAAKNFASTAAQSEANAKISEGNTGRSEQNAKKSEDNAKTSEENAKVSETKALTSEGNAYRSETSAKESEDRSRLAAVAADEAADEAVNAARNAAASEGNAHVSETNARESEKNAASHEAGAKESAENAANSAEAARKSAESIDLPKPTPDDAGKAIVVNENGTGFEFGKAGETPDWNAKEGEPGNVLNRTHYTFKPYEDIVFNLGTAMGGGYESVSDSIFKVSNHALTDDELMSCGLHFEGAYNPSYDVLSKLDVGVDPTYGSMCVEIYNRFYVISIRIPGTLLYYDFDSPGTYVMPLSESCPNFTIVAKEEVFPIDPKFIPGALLKKKVFTNPGNKPSEGLSLFMTAYPNSIISAWVKFPGNNLYTQCVIGKGNDKDGVNNNYFYTFSNIAVSQLSENGYTVTTDSLKVAATETKVSVGNIVTYGTSGVTVEKLVSPTIYSNDSWEENGIEVILYYYE